MKFQEDIKILLAAHLGVHSTFDKEKIESRLPLARKCVVNPFKEIIAQAGNTWSDLIAYFNKKQESIGLDIVERAINILEDSGIVNAGLGSVAQKDGVQRMDASIMRGSDLEYGAVGSLRGFQNPISVAKLILLKDDGHNMYAHDFAARLAEAAGIKKIIKGKNPPDAKKMQQHDKPPYDDNEEHGTVGAVCCIPLNVDSILSDGNSPTISTLAAGTSTGGFGSCEPGRIGDSCIIGAGTYANSLAAISCTGHGESIVKLGVSKSIADKYKMVQLQGRGNENNHVLIQNAVDGVMDEFSALFPNERDSLGVIALDRNFHLGIGIKGKALVWAALGVVFDKGNNKPQFYCISGYDREHFSIEAIDF